jgi:molybdate transport system permease protein
LNVFFQTANREHKPVEGLRGHVFTLAIFLFVGVFVAAWLGLIFADISYITWKSVVDAVLSRPIQAALWLSLWTTTLTVAIGLALSLPMGYALSRYRFPGQVVVDAIVDLPIILPPLIVGLSLLVFFQTDAGKWIESLGLQFVFRKSGIVLCQLLVSASFGIRAMKLTFDGIDTRLEHVALTLGSSRVGAFFRVALPMAWRGIVTAAILIWTRALGIFGPLMVFVGAVRMRTEVLPTTVYLEQSVGRLEVALAVAVLMLVMAASALVGIRVVGLGQR